VLRVNQTKYAKAGQREEWPQEWYDMIKTLKARAGKIAAARMEKEGDEEASVEDE